MVGYITISSWLTKRRSETWRHFTCTSVVIFLYISMACWRALLGFDEDHLARLCWGCRQCLLTQLL